MNIITKFNEKNITLEKILKNTKFENYSIIKMEQVHSDKFVEISNNYKVVGKIIEIPDVDAVITTKKNILLAVKSADCLPILIHWTDEKKKNVISAIHSGRVGTEKKILLKVLNYLKLKYIAVSAGSNESQKHVLENSSGSLTIWLGPAICKKCYQIDRKTDLHYDLYQKNLDQIEQVFPKNKFTNDSSIKINLFEVEIIRSKFCTLHDNDRFFSYRKSGKGVPMNYSLIGLTD